MHEADAGATDLRREMEKLKSLGQKRKTIQRAVDVMINVGGAIGDVGDAAGIGKGGRAGLVGLAVVYTELATEIGEATLCTRTWDQRFRTDGDKGASQDASRVL